MRLIGLTKHCKHELAYENTDVSRVKARGPVLDMLFFIHEKRDVSLAVCFVLCSIINMGENAPNRSIS